MSFESVPFRWARHWETVVARWDEVDAASAAAYVPPGVPWRASGEAPGAARRPRPSELLRLRALAGGEAALRALAKGSAPATSTESPPPALSGSGPASPASGPMDLPPAVAAAMIEAGLRAMESPPALPPPDASDSESD